MHPDIFTSFTMLYCYIELYIKRFLSSSSPSLIGLKVNIGEAQQQQSTKNSSNSIQLNRFT